MVRKTPSPPPPPQVAMMVVRSDTATTTSISPPAKPFLPAQEPTDRSAAWPLQPMPTPTSNTMASMPIHMPPMTTASTMPPPLGLHPPMPSHQSHHHWPQQQQQYQQQQQPQSSLEPWGAPRLPMKTTTPLQSPLSKKVSAPLSTNPSSAPTSSRYAETAIATPITPTSLDSSVSTVGPSHLRPPAPAPAPLLSFATTKLSPSLTDLMNGLNQAAVGDLSDYVGGDELMLDQSAGMRNTGAASGSSHRGLDGSQHRMPPSTSLSLEALPNRVSVPSSTSGMARLSHPASFSTASMAPSTVSARAPSTVRHGAASQPDHPSTKAASTRVSGRGTIMAMPPSSSHFASSATTSVPAARAETRSTTMASAKMVATTATATTATTMSIAPTASAAAAPKTTLASLPIEKVPRPPNSFMTFRMDKQHAVLASYPDANNMDISKIIGAMWRDADPAVKQIYRERAEEGRRLHRERFPGYHYTPGIKKRIYKDVDYGCGQPKQIRATNSTRMRTRRPTNAAASTSSAPATTAGATMTASSSAAVAENAVVKQRHRRSVSKPPASGLSQSAFASTSTSTSSTTASTSALSSTSSTTGAPPPRSLPRGPSPSHMPEPDAIPRTVPRSHPHTQTAKAAPGGRRRLATRASGKVTTTSPSSMMLLSTANDAQDAPAPSHALAAGKAAQRSHFPSPTTPPRGFRAMETSVGVIPDVSPPHNPLAGMSSTPAPSLSMAPTAANATVTPATATTFTAVRTPAVTMTPTSLQAPVMLSPLATTPPFGSAMIPLQLPQQAHGTQPRPVHHRPSRTPAAAFAPPAPIGMEGPFDRLWPRVPDFSNSAAAASAANLRIDTRCTTAHVPPAAPYAPTLAFPDPLAAPAVMAPVPPPPPAPMPAQAVYPPSILTTTPIGTEPRLHAPPFQSMPAAGIVSPSEMPASMFAWSSLSPVSLPSNASLSLVSPSSSTSFGRLPTMDIMPAATSFQSSSTSSYSSTSSSSTASMSRDSTSMLSSTLSSQSPASSMSTSSGPSAASCFGFGESAYPTSTSMTAIPSAAVPMQTAMPSGVPAEHLLNRLPNAPYRPAAPLQASAASGLISPRFAWLPALKTTDMAAPTTAVSISIPSAPAAMAMAGTMGETGSTALRNERAAPTDPGALDLSLDLGLKYTSIDTLIPTAAFGRAPAVLSTPGQTLGDTAEHWTQRDAEALDRLMSPVRSDSDGGSGNGGDRGLGRIVETGATGTAPDGHVAPAAFVASPMAMGVRLATPHGGSFVATPPSLLVSSTCRLDPSGPHGGGYSPSRGYVGGDVRLPKTPWGSHETRSPHYHPYRQRAHPPSQQPLEQLSQQPSHASQQLQDSYRPSRVRTWRGGSSQDLDVAAMAAGSSPTSLGSSSPAVGAAASPTADQTAQSIAVMTRAADMMIDELLGH